MNLPQDGIKLHRGNFTAIGRQIQPYLEDGKCFRMVLKPWRERRSLSQNALSHMWYSEISEYLISKGKTFATPAWVKDALKHTYLGYPAFLFFGVRGGAKRRRSHHRGASGGSGWRLAPRNNFMVETLEKNRSWTRYFLARELRKSLKPERRHR